MFFLAVLVASGLSVAHQDLPRRLLVKVEVHVLNVMWTDSVVRVLATVSRQSHLNVLSVHRSSLLAFVSPCGAFSCSLGLIIL